MTTPSPPAAVTEAGSFTCTHNGERALTKLGSGTLTVAGKPVLLTDAAATGAYTGCTFTDASNVAHQCDTTVISITRTTPKLTVGATPVLLGDDPVKSFDALPGPTPPLAVTVAAGQAKLTAR